MKTTGPFAVTVNEPLTLETPIDFPIAVQISNQSPYLMSVQISNKVMFVGPQLEQVFSLSHTTQSVTVTPSQLSGSVPSGSNSDVFATWFDVHDEAELEAAKSSHPVALTANAIGSSSVVTSDVQVTAPLDSAGNVLTAVASPVDSAGYVQTVQAPNAGIVSSGSVALSTTTATLAAAASALYGLILTNSGTSAVTVTVTVNGTAQAPLIVAAGATVPIDLYGLSAAGGSVTASATADCDATLIYQ